MKLVFGGKYKDERPLQADVPSTAYLIGRKKNDYIDTMLPPFILQISVCFILGLITLVTIILSKAVPGHLAVQTFLLGCLLGLILLPMHELLHALAYPKGSEVRFWIYPKAGVFFIASTTSVSKFRYCLSTLLPVLTLGLPPLVCALAMPNLSSLFLGIAFTGLLACADDFIDLATTLRQVPTEAKILDTGLNSYWYC